MISDGSLVSTRIIRETCLKCGIARRGDGADLSNLFDAYTEHYSHSLHYPGGPAYDRARSRQYAEWLSAELGSLDGLDVFEVGCGSGGLLSELAKRFPGARCGGIEPSRRASDEAASRGLNVTSGFLAPERRFERAHDLVISVNVIEHVASPSHFLANLGRLARRKGCIALICPDGDRPSTELLMYDHLYSFTRTAMWLLSATASLSVVRTSSAPDQIGPFRLFVLAHSDDPSLPPPGNAVALVEQRSAFLNRWNALEQSLCRRIDPIQGALACFGTGEKAMLIRAYAPRVWHRITLFTADGIDPGYIDGRSVVPFERLADSRDPMLLAVRPSYQPSLAARLQRNGRVVIRWDDLASD